MYLWTIKFKIILIIYTKSYRQCGNKYTAFYNPPEKLHITIMMLKLYEESERNYAITIF